MAKWLKRQIRQVQKQWITVSSDWGKGLELWSKMYSRHCCGGLKLVWRSLRDFDDQEHLSWGIFSPERTLKRPQENTVLKNANIMWMMPLLQKLMASSRLHTAYSCSRKNLFEKKQLLSQVNKKLLLAFHVALGVFYNLFVYSLGKIHSRIIQRSIRGH